MRFKAGVPAFFFCDGFVIFKSLNSHLDVLEYIQKLRKGVSIWKY